MTVALLLEAATGQDVKTAAVVVIVCVWLGVAVVCTFLDEIKKLLEKK